MFLESIACMRDIILVITHHFFNVAMPDNIKKSCLDCRCRYYIPLIYLKKNSSTASVPVCHYMGFWTVKYLIILQNLFYINLLTILLQEADHCTPKILNGKVILYLIRTCELPRALLSTCNNFSTKQSKYLSIPYPFDSNRPSKSLLLWAAIYYIRFKIHSVFSVGTASKKEVITTKTFMSSCCNF